MTPSDRPVGKDKTGRIRTRRQSLANERNMLIGRVASMRGHSTNLSMEIRSRMTDIRLTDVRNAFASDFDQLQSILRRIEQRLIGHYQSWHQIGIPKPTQENTDESK